MLRLRYIAAGLAFLAAACSDSAVGPSTSSTDLISQDVADLAADGAAEDVGAFVGMDGQVAAFPSAAFLVAPGGRGPRLNDCTFASGAFNCARTRQNGLDVTRVVTLFDAAGASQSAYDKLLTASIHVVMDVTGDVTRERWSASLSRHRDFTVTGLAGEETTRTVNGSGSETASKSGTTRKGVSRTFAITGTSTTVNVVFPVHSEDSDPWPLSGTTTRVFTITPDEGAVITRTVVINYDGTASPTGTLNGEPYTFDLTKRKGNRK